MLTKFISSERERRTVVRADSQAARGAWRAEQRREGGGDCVGRARRERAVDRSGTRSLTRARGRTGERCQARTYSRGPAARERERRAERETRSDGIGRVVVGLGKRVDRGLGRICVRHTSRVERGAGPT
ncbi:hypothetical protein GOBAR_DD04554 [Gossypium barbadense]|nr:hypothetical protein GOBAR_DD04554 [Gossypium barbadense]